MFNNKKPNIVLMSDNTNTLTMVRLFGLQKVAYVLRQHGFEVAIINHLSVFSVEEIKHLLKNLVSDQTLFVGINNFFYMETEGVFLEENNGIEFKEPAESGSILPHSKRHNADIKQLIKEINPKCKLVCGGPNQIDAAFNKDFDYVVLGYAEMSVVNLAKHLQSADIPLKKSYRSIYGPVIVNDPTAEGYDFSQSYMEHSLTDAVLPGEMLALEIGRGCIFKCAFCSYPMNGKKKFDYIRHRDLIVAELIDNFEKFKITKYIIVDDTFNDSVEKCEMIHEISQLLPFKIEYWAYIRLDLLAAKPECIPLLIDSGCRGMFFGIETFNAKTATAIRKGGSREKLISTINYIKETWGNRVSLYGSFIFGLPYETVESMQQTAAYLLSDKNLLDGWGLQTLKIRHQDYTNASNNSFLSDLDLNYKKYGYQEMGKYEEVQVSHSYIKKSGQYMTWKNQYTDFFETLNLVNQSNNMVEARSDKNRLPSLIAFELAGLGVPLDDTLNALAVDIDWNKFDRLKLSRSIEYKKILFEQLHIPDLKQYCQAWDFDQLRHKTFSRYLLAQVQLTNNQKSAKIETC